MRNSSTSAARYKIQRLIFVSLIILIPLRVTYAQSGISDSVSIQEISSVSGDSVFSDTNDAGMAPESIDTTIHYFGAPIEYLLDSQRVVLHGTQEKPARVEYSAITLSAARITVLLDSNLLRAEGIIDTSYSTKPESLRYTGTPVFNQKGEEPLYGERIEYNLKTRKGRVIHGRTKYDDGYFSGENITRVDSRTLQICSGIFTTCDLEDHPHFYFKSSQMKILLNDKVITRSVAFYIADVPVFYLPFAVFPIRRGRHSGLIIPTFGTSQLEGRYLRGLGYYYAPNDYIDLKGLVDFFENTGFMFRGDTRYAKRYSLGGNISGSITRKNFVTGQQERMWDLDIHHKQEINRTTRLNVEGRFVSSGNFYQNLSLNRQRRTTRELISNATLHKSWPNAKTNLTVNLQRRHDLELGNLSSTLPQLKFSRTAPIYPFRRGKKKSGSEEDETWFTNLSFRYNSTFINRVTKRRSNINQSFTRQEPRGLQHTFNFLLPMTLFRHVQLSPSISMREEWYDKTVSQKYDALEGILSGHEKSFAARHLFDGQVSATTKIYGMFAPKVGNLTALRHVMTPTMSLSYRPDFSSSRFGYFKTVYDTAGIATTYDRFSEAAYGGTPRGRVGSLNMNLGNILQMKTASGEEEKKRDIFNLNFSTNYNFAADQFPLNDLLTSFRLLSFADLDMAASHSFYKTDPTTGQRLNEFRKGMPRLQRLQFTTGFRMKGGENGGGEVVDENSLSGVISEDEFLDTVTPDREERFIKDEESPSFSIPYEFRVGARYNLEQFNPLNKRKIFSTTTDLNFNLTKKWKISHSAEIDVVNRRIIYQDFSFYRDLHCFEFRFNWTPTGALKGYYLNIRIKSPRLHDLKIEDRSYGGSVLGRR